MVLEIILAWICRGGSNGKPIKFACECLCVEGKQGLSQGIAGEKICELNFLNFPTTIHLAGEALCSVVRFVCGCSAFRNLIINSEGVPPSW